MKTTNLQFLREKIALFSAAAHNDIAREDFRRIFEVHLPAGDSPDFPTMRARKFDRALEQWISVSIARESAQGPRQELRAKYGFDRLAHTPEDVVRRVIKRGRIVNDQEAEVVRGFVANQGNEELLGTGGFFRLAEILDKAGH